MFETLQKIKKTVYLLGITSFLNDLSSDMILAVLPMFIVALGGAGVGKGVRTAPRDALIADAIGEENRGTALGTFHLSIGLAVLVSSIVAGILWQMGPQITFFYGSGMAFCGAVSLLITTKLEKRRA